MPEPLRILIVEDVPTDAELIVRELRRSGYAFESRRVDDETSLRQALAELRPDIVLSDYAMPDFDGLRALSVTREVAPETPVIIVTGSQNEETAAACMRAGAFDYVLKERLVRLGPALGGALERARLERESRAAQEALRRAHDHYLTLLETFPALIWRAGTDGKCNYFNQTWLEFTGRALEQELGDGWAEGVHPEDFQRCLGTYRDAFEKREPFGMEYRLRYRDGTYRWIADFGRPIYGLDGGFDGYLGVCFDQQDRVLFEEALAESERRLSLALNSSHIGLWDWNIETNEVHLSAQWFAQLGLEPGEMPETWATWEGLTHPEDLPRLKELLARYVENPWPDYVTEIRMRHRNGAWRHIVSRATLIAGREDAPRRMLGTHIDVTDLRTAAEAIASERERFQALADNAPYGLMLVERSGVIAYLNRAFSAMFGYRPEDLPHVDAWHARAFPDPGVRRQVATGWELLSRGRGHASPVASSHLARSADGRDKHVRVVTSPLPNGQTLLAMEDVTARVRAEERERTAAAERDALLARLQLLFDRLPMAFIVTDPDLTIREWNPAAEHIFGYSRDEMVGHSPFGLITGHEMRPAVEQLVRRLASEKTTQVASHHNRTKDGSTIVCRWHDTPLLDQSDALVGVIAMAEDITEQARGEEARRRMAAAIESTTETVVIMDPRGRILHVNPAFERLMGVTAGAVEGCVHGLFEPGAPLAPRSDRDLAPLLQTGTPWRGRHESVARDGAAIVEEVTVSPVRDAEGALVNLVAVGRDVTRELSLQEQLAQAQKMEAIGHLAGGVAHDFNNILAVIQASAELLQRELSREDPRAARVHEIESAASRAVALTRQLLAFARRQVLMPRVVRLATIVDDTVTMLRRLIGEDIALEISHASSSGHVRADAGQIEQVVLNLAVNARDAMPQGGVLSISTSGVDLGADDAAATPLAPGSYQKLRIADTGTGMSRETAEHIFEPFFTTKAAGRGTGLGLSTVYGIVTQSDGWISVDSREGEGTVFSVLLPRVQAPLDEERAEVVKAAAAGGSETILLVEDDAALRDITQEILETSGYTVLVAGDGWQALERASALDGAIDLLLTDVVMPGMSGPELATNLWQTRPDMRVLYATGYTSETALQHGLLSGEANLIEKPYSVEGLRANVRLALEHSKPPA